MKKLLLSLLLTVASVTSYAQTVHTVNASTTGDFTIESGDKIKYGVNSGLVSVLTKFTLTCTDTDTSSNKGDFYQSTSSLVSVAGLQILFTSSGTSVPTVPGTYKFKFSYHPLVCVFCSTTTNTFTITVVPKGTLGFKNIDNTPEFSVFCSNGVLTLNNAKESKVTKISVYNISGATVYSSNKSEKTIDVSSLANGMYILEVVEGGSRTTKKFIKQ